MEGKMLSRNEIVQQYLRIGHGNLTLYLPLLEAVRQEPEFFAHLISWNSIKGNVRDSKVAFPILALRGKLDNELFENAVANLCLLSPRELLKAAYFHRDSQLPVVTSTGSQKLKSGITLYLRQREANPGWFNRVALQHRNTLKALYAINHIKPSSYAQQILFDRDYPIGTALAALKQLKYMDPLLAAGTIMEFKIPFLIAAGALGGLTNKPDLTLALIERMSGNELVTNSKMLMKAGCATSPALRAAYDKALERAKETKPTKFNVLKAGKAAEQIEDESIKEKLLHLQEQKLDSMGGPEGDWLVIVDRSGSMEKSFEPAMQVAAYLARICKGKVYLVYVNIEPILYDVTGLDLKSIRTLTKRISASGGTWLGGGLDIIMENGLIVNGIVLCSDGGENRLPFFADVYVNYAQRLGISPTVYLYHVPGDLDRFTPCCESRLVQITKFELGENVDYYSLPNLMATMRSNRYSLADEIMETKLLTFKDVFQKGV